MVVDITPADDAKELNGSAILSLLEYVHFSQVDCDTFSLCGAKMCMMFFASYYHPSVENVIVPV